MPGYVKNSIKDTPTVQLSHDFWQPNRPDNDIPTSQASRELPLASASVLPSPYRFTKLLRMLMRAFLSKPLRQESGSKGKVDEARFGNKKLSYLRIALLVCTQTGVRRQRLETRSPATRSKRARDPEASPRNLENCGMWWPIHYCTATPYHQKCTSLAPL